MMDSNKLSIHSNEEEFIVRFEMKDDETHNLNQKTRVRVARKLLIFKCNAMILSNTTVPVLVVMFIDCWIACRRFL